MGVRCRMRAECGRTAHHCIADVAERDVWFGRSCSIMRVRDEDGLWRYRAYERDRKLFFCVT